MDWYRQRSGYSETRTTPSGNLPSRLRHTVRVLHREFSTPVLLKTRVLLKTDQFIDQDNVEGITIASQSQIRRWRSAAKILQPQIAMSMAAVTERFSWLISTSDGRSCAQALMREASAWRCGMLVA